jgi:hypothetical protein
MRTRTTILMVAATAALLAGGVSPSDAASEQTGAANAVPGRMLTAPRSEALMTQLPV